MGGTSFDIGLVEGGIPKVTTEGNFQRLPVKIPIIDLHIIGAGGGSIAWIDRGGALNVGPMSAGADPGPACYNLGGDEPTVTDANLVLGRLNPDYFNGGEMPLFPDLARKSIEEEIAGPVGMSVEEAAVGIITVINANMVKGISSVTIQRGIDTREWSLASFGGSGGVHALDIAKRLMDHGFHPPTNYFPLIVPEALMIEPTETESKETLDAFVTAMLQIADEAKEDPVILQSAPHTTPFGRLDEVRAARQLVLCCWPVEASSE